MAIPARPARRRLLGNRAAVARLRVSFFSEEPYRSGMKRIIVSLGMLCAMTALAHAQDITKAVAKLESRSGSKVTGTVTFTKMGDEVQVVADIQNLAPGKHGFHIHEKSD